MGRRPAGGEGWLCYLIVDDLGASCGAEEARLVVGGDEVEVGLHDKGGGVGSLLQSQSLHVLVDAPFLVRSCVAHLPMHVPQSDRGWCCTTELCVEGAIVSIGTLLDYWYDSV